MENTLDIPLKPKTYFFENSFEHWLITEIYRLNYYHKKEYQLYYLLTKDDAEIDLIVERPGKENIIIKIKSTDRPDLIDAKKLERFLDDFEGAKAFIFCLIEQAQQMGKVLCLPWQDGITKIFS